jgi:cation-transporting P-type ATPase 13A2
MQKKFKGVAYFVEMTALLTYICPNIKCCLTTLRFYFQALHPFYVFQLFSCALWFSDEYIWYASCIVIISVLSLAAQIYQTRSVSGRFEDIRKVM